MPQRTPLQATVGEALRERRAELGVTQERLAEMSNMHRTFVGGIERGERNPTIATLDRLAAALGIPASVLLARSEQLRRKDGGNAAEH